MTFVAPDFDGAVNRLQARGVAYGNLRGAPHLIQHRADDALRIYFHDRDGHWIEISDRP